MLHKHLAESLSIIALICIGTFISTDISYDYPEFVHEMIDDVKGNLGYVKLSKLSQLRKKIRAIKDRNKTLLHANDLLIQTEKFLAKKLQIS